MLSLNLSAATLVAIFTQLFHKFVIPRSKYQRLRMDTLLHFRKPVLPNKIGAELFVQYGALWDQLYLAQNAKKECP